jgi:hypothetical protein
MTHPIDVRSLLQSREAVVVPITRRIRHRYELSESLSQSACPLLLEAEELIRPFAQMAKWQARQEKYGPVAGTVSLLIAFGIAQRFLRR